MESEPDKIKMEFISRLHQIKAQNSSVVSRLIMSMAMQKAREHCRNQELEKAEEILKCLHEVSSLQLEGTIDQSIEALKPLSPSSRACLRLVLEEALPTFGDAINIHIAKRALEFFENV